MVYVPFAVKGYKHADVSWKRPEWMSWDRVPENMCNHSIMYASVRICMLELRPTSFQSKRGVQVGWLSSGVVATVYTRRGAAMLTFLVLRTLYVCYAAEISGVVYYGVYTKGWVGFKGAKIFSCMWNAGNGDMWIYILRSSKKQFNAEAPALKTTKSIQKAPIKLIQWKVSKKTPRNANLAKFSRKNFAKFGSYKCAFRWSENAIIKKNVCFLRARFPVRRVFASSIPRNEMMTTYIMILPIYPLETEKNCTGINILYNILENMFYFLVGYRCLWWWVQWFL